MTSSRETCFSDSVCVSASGDNFPLPSLAFYIYDNHLQEELFMWHLAKCFKNTIAIRLFLTTPFAEDHVYTSSFRGSGGIMLLAWVP